MTTGGLGSCGRDPVFAGPAKARLDGRQASQYNDANWVTKITVREITTPANVRQSFEYGYDQVGNRTWVTTGGGDASGNVTALSDASGVVQETYTYDVFGKPTAKDGSGNLLSSPSQPFLFTGREYDSATGLYHYRNRAYSPDLGRFLQPDPIHFSGGDINLYRYVANNPINFDDSLGLYSCPSKPGCEEVGPISPNRSSGFGLGLLWTHKVRGGVAAQVTWMSPCSKGYFIKDWEVTKKPTAGSGGGNAGFNSAYINVETRYAAVHSGAAAQAATAARFCCCCPNSL